MRASDAKAHIDEAYKLLTTEAWRGNSLSDMEPVDGLCAVVEDLRRIDVAIGPRGKSVFAIMAETVDAAYTEIKAARAALSR